MRQCGQSTYRSNEDRFRLAVEGRCLLGYETMLVSHTHRFLFVHVPKTAGSSVTEALRPVCHQPEKVWVNRVLAKIGIHVNWFGPLSWKSGRKHTTARQMQKMFPRSVFDGYFKFAFVRNPWDLMVSYYHYLQAQESHHRSTKVLGLGGFREYLKYEMQRNKISQTRFLTDANGELIVDFVGRFEDLAVDFGKICRRLNIDATIEHHNRSTHREYPSYYDDETARWVAEHWQDDIQRFGYEFNSESR
ncbi:MAG: sulfotransferase family 2 domain-containing protein [Planctomycetota bacterium]|nr:sulfotransferase family 2 domain-containing protein [Planctomycetota bacterium]